MEKKMETTIMRYIGTTRVVALGFGILLRDSRGFHWLK